MVEFLGCGMKKCFFIALIACVLLVVNSDAYAKKTDFTVDDIYVELDDIAPNKIKDAAIDDAVEQALQKLLQKLGYGKTIDQFIQEYKVGTLLQLVKKFKLNDEVQHDRHFSATFSITFTQMPFAQILAENTNLISVGGNKILLLPYYEFNDVKSLWGDLNLWKMAWESYFSQKKDDNLLMPLFDISDVQSLSYSDVESKKISKVSTLLKRYKVQNVIVTKAKFHNGTLTTSFWPLINSGNIKAGELSYQLTDITEDNHQAIEKILALAAEDMHSKILIEKEFERIYSDNIYTVRAKHESNSLAGYHAMKKILMTLQVDKKPRLIELTPQYAIWELSYKKEIASFISFLYTKGIVLQDQSGNWQLKLVKE